MNVPVTGACQCGAIRYVVNAQPLSIYACHCAECQRQSASAFGLSMLVPRADFALTQGTPKNWVRTADSGRQVDCLFCGDCGVRIVHMPQHSPQIAIVRAGTLDDTTSIRIAGHIWTRSRQPWFHIPAEAVAYKQQPTDFARLIEAYGKL